MDDNPYAIVLSSDLFIIDTQLIYHSYSKPLASSHIRSTYISSTSSTKATISVSMDASSAFDYDAIVAKGFEFNMIWSMSADGETQWKNG